MPTSPHVFNRCNTDDEPSADGMGSAFVAAVNLHLESGQVFPATGNVLVATLLPPTSGQTVSLGCIEDEATNTAIVFYYNTAGRHRLVRYTPSARSGAGAETLILEWSGLNLAPELVLQGRVIGGILIYRDALGEPRAVPLARAEAGVFTPTYLTREPFALHLVKVPPSQPPTAVRQPATGADPRETLRIIHSRAYQFSYRWRYIDGETTPFAGYSAWLDVLTDPSAATFSSILVTLPGEVPAGVMAVDVLVRDAATSIWQVADTLQRKAGVLPSSLTFYGQVLGGAVSEAEVAKLFEACWPCQALEIAGSRVFEADILEGYPTPEPQFTAVVHNGNEGASTDTLYTVTVQIHIPPPPSGPGIPDDESHDDDTFQTYYYAPAQGTYPDSASTYFPVTTSVAPGFGIIYTKQPIAVSYREAFEATYQNEYSRTISQSTVAYGQAGSEPRTFHERSSYRVVVQFYDALGRAFGCSSPATVAIPARPKGDATFRSIEATLTTTGAALNVEIPIQAASYQFLIARNDTTIYFLQGRAADVLAYLGQQITVAQDGSRSEAPQTGDGTKLAHQKLLIDIGSFVASGQGYSYVEGSGDTVVFLVENKEFPILAQRGDYLEIDWSDYPRATLDAAGHSQALIEIRSPNTTPTAIYYERGPRLPVTRTVVDGVELRSYSQRRVLLEGDCYLVPLRFPFIDRTDPDPIGGTYQPPNKKSYVEDPSGPILVESMVPPFRFAPTSTVTKTVYEKREKGGFFHNLVSNPLNLIIPPLAIYNSAKYLLSDDPDTPANSSLTTANTRARTAANLLWLDVSWGGRPGVIVPRALQQVRRNIIRHSNQKQNGNLINGLGSFEPLSFYDKLPQELGPVVRLSVADQAQADGTVLLVNQEQGVTSLYLGQQIIQNDAGTQLLAYTDKVIGGGNTLRGGYGCTDAGSIARYAGAVFYFSRERRELVRYNKGLTPLGIQYKFRLRLEELADRYQSARVTGCFDPNRQEYWLTFHATQTLPGTTVVWSERREAWADAVSAVPTAAGGVNAELVSWQGSKLYRHLATAPVGTFYGVYTPPQVTFVAASPGAGLAKTWQQVGVRSLAPWQPTALATPSGQQSRILRPWQKFIQGVWRAAVRRDENSSGFAGDPAKALHGGRVLQSESLRVTLTCPEQNPSPLVGATVDFLLNSGQQPNQ